MSYDYAAEKQKLFTEHGLDTLLKIRDNVRGLLQHAGSFMSSYAWDGCNGDAWLFMAALDYLVERGEIRRITPVGTCAGQHEIFVRVGAK